MYTYQRQAQRGALVGARPALDLPFLRKTYGLFLGGVISAAGGAMLGLYAGTPIAAGKGVMIPPLVAFVMQHFFVAIIAFFGAFFALMALRHKPRVNVVALLGFTFVAGLFLAPTLYIATLMARLGSTVSSNPVRDAFLLSTAAFGGLTGYVMVSRKNFSFLGGMLSMGLWVLIGAMLIGFFVGSQVFHLAIASVGVLLFGAYVLYDTSKILHREERVTPIDAAISLFLDFLNLFQFVLMILSSGSRDE